MRTVIGEHDTRAGDQVLDGLRDQHLPGLGEIGNPRRDMHREPFDAPGDQFAFAGMDADAPVRRKWRENRRRWS